MKRLSVQSPSALDASMLTERKGTARGLSRSDGPQEYDTPFSFRLRRNAENDEGGKNGGSGATPSANKTRDRTGFVNIFASFQDISSKASKSAAAATSAGNVSGASLGAPNLSAINTSRSANSNGGRDATTMAAAAMGTATTRTAAMNASSSVIHRTLNSTQQQLLSVLPRERLRELCLRFVAARLRRHAAGEKEAVHHSKLVRLRREIFRKMKGGIAAVVFSSVLIHQRLRRMSRNLASHRCDPYSVLLGQQDMQATVGRAVCVFAVTTSHADDLLYFVLDKATHKAAAAGSAMSGGGWRIWLIDPNIVSDLDAHFVPHNRAQLLLARHNNNANASGGEHSAASAAGASSQVKLVETIAICEYDESAKQMLPISICALHPSVGPHFHIIRDFERQVNASSQKQSDDVTNAASSRDEDLLEAQELFVDVTTAFSAPLPRYRELCVLPVEVQTAVRGLATEVLSRYLYPRLLLRQRKRYRERMSRAAFGYPLLVEAVLKIPQFEMWPPSLLEELLQCVKPYVADRHEFILHERECPGSAMYFIVAGSADVLQRIDNAKKSLGKRNTRLVRNVGAVNCFGALSFVTDDPRLTSIRATSMCCMWRLFRTDFVRLYNKLPPAVRSHVQDTAFQRRTENMKHHSPMTIAMLKAVPAFANSSEQVLRQLLVLIRPLSVPRDTVLAKADTEGNSMYFLRSGHCGVFRYIRDRREDVYVQQLLAPAVIGDDVVMCGGSHLSTIKALTSCDLYTLTKEEFEGVMQHQAAEWNVVIENANRARQARLQDSQYRFKDMAVNIPLVSSLLPIAARNELTSLFNPILYHPRQVVCSTAHFADRIIIVVEGQVRLQNGKLWEQGEAAGFTCIVPHRWGQSAVALTSSKLIELKLDDYVAYLKRRNIYGVMKACVEALLFPKAAEPERLYWALLQTQKLKNPPMYPISQSEVVNPHEARFGLEVMSYGHHQHVRVHRRAEPQATTPMEKEVQRSLDSIAERMRKRQAVRSFTLAATPGQDVPRWTRSRLLVAPRNVAEDVSRLPDASNDPLLVEYRAKRRKPVALRRPASANE